MEGWSNPTVRTTEEGEQVGPRMHKCVELAASGPVFSDADVYPSKNQLAQAVGPNGSQDYGYRIVDRCLRKGLVELDADHPDATPQGRGAVVISEKGQRYLSNQEA
jgi:hypothetical protein